MSDGYFLNWLADRLVYHYHEDENVDFVQRLRVIASGIDEGKSKWERHSHTPTPGAELRKETK